MSGFRCVCGYSWKDKEDDPNGGWIIRDQDKERFYVGVAKDVARFIDAIIEGHREEWVAQRFSRTYPMDLSNEQIINDLFLLHQNMLFINQCANCGRIWIQEAPSDPHYRAFSPDGEWRGTLEVPGFKEPTDSVQD